MALEKVSEQQSEAGAGVGMGLGVMMPAMFADLMKNNNPDETSEKTNCSECNNAIPINAKFCPSCGNELLVFQQCFQCGNNISALAKFCSDCGSKVDEKHLSRECPHCEATNLTESIFCNKCGEKL